MNPIFIEKLLIITTFNNFIVPKCFIIIILLLLFKPSFKWMTKELHPSGYEDFYIFKITNYILHWIYITIYFSIFVIMIFVIRLYRIGNELDLKPFIIFLKFLYFNKEYLILLILILLLLVVSFFVIGLLKRIKDRLELELLRRHLIWYYLSSQSKHRLLSYFFSSLSSEMLRGRGMFVELSYSEKKQDDSNEFPIGFYVLFMLLFVKLQLGYYIRLFLSGPLYFMYVLSEEFNFHCLFFKNLLYEYYLPFLCKLFSMTTFSLINLLIIIYDIYYNDCILIKIFYILPAYFICYILNRLDNYYMKKGGFFHKDLCQIVYEIYYCSERIQYVFEGLEEIPEKILTVYVNKGLGMDFKTEMDLNKDLNIDSHAKSRRILYFCRFVLVDKENNIFYNSYTKETAKVTHTS